jgi:hypothetical protein
MEHFTETHIELRDLSISHIRDEHGAHTHSLNPYLEIAFNNDPDRAVARSPALRNNNSPMWGELKPLRYKVIGGGRRRKKEKKRKEN